MLLDSLLAGTVLFSSFAMRSPNGPPNPEDYELSIGLKNEDFYVNKSNFFAYNLIDKWPNWEKKILNIYGEKHCGKTHLSNIFKKKYNAYKIQAKEFNNQSLKEFKVFENLILDDFDEIQACANLSWSTTTPTPSPLGTSKVESLLSTKLGNAMS